MFISFESDSLMGTYSWGLSAEYAAGLKPPARTPRVFSWIILLIYYSWSACSLYCWSISPSKLILFSWFSHGSWSSWLIFDVRFLFWIKRFYINFSMLMFSPKSSKYLITDLSSYSVDSSLPSFNYSGDRLLCYICCWNWALIYYWFGLSCLCFFSPESKSGDHFYYDCWFALICDSINFSGSGDRLWAIFWNVWSIIFKWSLFFLLFGITSSCLTGMKENCLIALIGSRLF